MIGGAVGRLADPVLLMLDPSHVVTPAPEPAYCPSCELRHTRRPDWLCPRCGKPVETEIPPPRARAASPDEDEGYPLGSRIAGAVMIAGAGLLGAELARHAAGAHPWRSIAAAALLAVLGIAAALKRTWARWAAAGAAVLALVLLAEDLIRTRLPALLPDPVPLAIRAPVRELIRPLHPVNVALALAFAAGAVLLLAGRPGRVRLATGVALAAPLLVALAIRAFAS